MTELDEPTYDELKTQVKGLKAHVMNLMGKLEIRENFVPQVAIDLASQHKLEMVNEENDCTARIRKTFNPNNHGS